MRQRVVLINPFRPNLGEVYHQGVDAAEFAYVYVWQTMFLSIIADWFSRQLQTLLRTWWLLHALCRVIFRERMDSDYDSHLGHLYIKYRYRRVEGADAVRTRSKISCWNWTSHHLRFSFPGKSKWWDLNRGSKTLVFTTITSYRWDWHEAWGLRLGLASRHWIYSADGLLRIRSAAVATPGTWLT